MNITYAALLEQVKAYQPGKYHTTRNYTNGAVTSWSPYISRGLLSPVLAMEQLKKKHSKKEWIGLMQQMAWREYFQRVWQQKGDLILQDLKSAQAKVVLESLPIPMSEGNTGIQALDNAIHQLYDTGYLHNHVRMYISMLHSNIFKAAWLPGAKWMYANLLDHDPAANFLSWQWVAGTFSSKQYIANQENINKYTNTKQLGTFLDTEYENLTEAIFNVAGQIKSNHTGKWSACLIDLAKTNIPGLKIFIGNFEDLNQILQTKSITANASVEDTQSEKSKPVIYFKEHPTTLHYKGIQETRDWLFPEVNGYYPSFFGYWKKCERYIK